MKEQVFEYLNKLRKSGEINMFGAILILQEEFELTYVQARDYLLEWMKS